MTFSDIFKKIMVTNICSEWRGQAFWVGGYISKYKGLHGPNALGPVLGHTFSNE